MSNISGSPSKVKGVPYLNSDLYCQFIGPKNWGKALIDEELTTCLLDSGSQLNFITPAYAHKWGMDIMSLDSLAQEVGGKIPPILGIGGIMVDPEGFVMMNVKVPCVKGYNEDQIAIVMDDPGMKEKNEAGPLQPKGPPQNKLAHEMAKASLPGRATSQGAPPK